MGKEIDAYKISDIEVTITETEQLDKLHVDCNDGHYHSAFTIRRYEYKNYKRHMNQRIKDAYNKQHQQEEE